mgnify:CR=1 FL=1
MKISINRNKLYKKSIFVIIVLISAIMLLPPMIDRNMNPVTEHTPYQVSEKAKALHKTLIIGDWHADSALWNRDLKKIYDYGHVDIPRMQKGNVALQMFTTVTKSPSGQNYDSNKESASDNITALAIVQRWPVQTWTSLFERAMYQANKIKRLEIDDPENFMLIESKRSKTVEGAGRALLEMTGGGSAPASPRCTALPVC